MSDSSAEDSFSSNIIDSTVDDNVFGRRRNPNVIASDSDTSSDEDEQIIVPSSGSDDEYNPIQEISSESDSKDDRKVCIESSESDDESFVPARHTSKRGVIIISDESEDSEEGSSSSVLTSQKQVTPGGNQKYESKHVDSSGEENVPSDLVNQDSRRNPSSSPRSFRGGSLHSTSVEKSFEKSSNQGNIFKGRGSGNTQSVSVHDDDDALSVELPKSSLDFKDKHGSPSMIYDKTKEFSVIGKVSAADKNRSNHERLQKSPGEVLPSGVGDKYKFNQKLDSAKWSTDSETNAIKGNKSLNSSSGTDHGKDIADSISKLTLQTESHSHVPTGNSISAIARQNGQEFRRKYPSVEEITVVDNGSNSSFPVPSSEMQLLNAKIEIATKSLHNKKMICKTVNLSALPDKGVRLQMSISQLEAELKNLKAQQSRLAGNVTNARMESLVNPEQDVQERKKSDENPQYQIALPPLNPFGAVPKQTATQRRIESVTTDALRTLHDSLKTCPGEEVEADDPVGLKVKLMPHQRHALAWLLWREEQKPSGGILADDMGLGKTLTMISLVMQRKQEHREKSSRKSQEKENWMSKKDGLIHSSATLLVCPASLLNQWEKEIERRCHYGVLRAMVYHGKDRESNPKRVAKHDIVITTYNLILREAGSIPKKKNKNDLQDSGDECADGKKGVLHQICWDRIILDEAHVVRNHRSQTTQAVCNLKGMYRWALTGTPIHNKELDLFALLCFLKCSPFNDYQVWIRYVNNKSAEGMRRLNTVMKSIMLRRTKEQLQQKGHLQDLPSRQFHDLKVQLSKEEQDVYDQILTLSRSLFAQFLEQQEDKELAQYGITSRAVVGRTQVQTGNPFIPGSALSALYNKMNTLQNDKNVKAHHLLVLLLRLRQACCHPGLIKAMLEVESCKSDGIVDDEGMDIDILDRLNRMSLLDEGRAEMSADEAVKKSVMKIDNPVFQFEKPSSKMKAVLKELESHVIPKHEKAVIVSQWTSFLDIVQKHLHKMGVSTDMLTGSVPIKQRMDIVDKFNKKSQKTQVLLLSLTAGGVGLNLVGGNHLILMDLHWNPQLETQACDRIYRVGQTRPVHVYRFICQETVEQRIADLQQKKLDLAKTVLTGAKLPQANKLTLDDLKLLFNVH